MKQLPRKARVFFSALFSLKTTSVVLLWLLVLTIWGTVYEVRFGLYDSQRLFFHSWTLMAWGIVPLPGVRLSAAFLFMQCAAVLVRRCKRGLGDAGMLLIHAGVLALIIGMAVVAFTSREAKLTLAQGEQSAVAAGESGELQLPVRVTLLEFQKKDYPGTTMARSYESRVRIEADGVNREAVISMNRPLRYKSFTFYQESYSQDGDFFRSTLAVVKNPGKKLLYWACVIIAAGFLYHFSLKLFFAMVKGSHEKSGR